MLRNEMMLAGKCKLFVQNRFLLVMPNRNDQCLDPFSPPSLVPSPNMKIHPRLSFGIAAALALIWISAPVVCAQVGADSKLVNLSARGQVASAEDALVAGFVIEGTQPLRVLVRIAGPALATFGIENEVSSPKLQLFAGENLVAENQGWSNSDDADEIAQAAALAGAFPFSLDSMDSAIITDLAPGSYTAVASGMPPQDGVGLIEVYELPSTGSAILTEAKLAEVEAIVDAAIANYEIPGIMYAFKFRGEPVWSSARGVQDTESMTPLTPDHHFRIGSASKTFIGMMGLRLIEQDKLEFETTIDRMLPEGILSNYDREKITVRMLLSHTSGINNYTNDIADWFFPYILDRTRVWTNEELVELVNSKFDDPNLGMVFTPGAGWFYSNTNTVTLGMIIEEIMGKPIHQVITEEFIVPLGLRNTIYPLPGNSELPEPYARGYMNWANFTGEGSLPATDTDVSIYDPSGVGPAGPMISTAGDLAQWMEAVATNPTIGAGPLRRGHIDWKYFTSFAGGEPGASVGSYGMNMAHEPDPNNNAQYWIVGHRGQLSGYDTAMMYLPEQEVALVLACSRSLLSNEAESWPTNALTAALNDVIAVLFPDLIAENQISSSNATNDRVEVKALKSSTSAPVREFRAPLTEY